MLKIINFKDTVLSNLEKELNSEFNLNLDVKIFYSNFHIILDNNILILDKKFFNIYNVIINNGFEKNFLDKVSFFIDKYFKKLNIDFNYLNIISYFSYEEIKNFGKIFKLEINRKYYNINNKYFIEKNLLLEKLFNLGKLKFNFDDEKIVLEKNKFLRKFNPNNEEKFLFIDSIGFYKNKKYIIKGIFNRFLDIINILDGYFLFKFYGLNIPKNIFFINKKIYKFDYFFIGYSYLEANNFLLGDISLYKNKILLEIQKLTKIFINKKKSSLNDINNILNTIPGECKQLKFFDNKNLHYSYGYFNLDIVHFLRDEEQNIYFIDYNKILFAPLIIIFIYTFIFFISVVFLLDNKFNIKNNFLHIFKFFPEILLDDIKLLSKEELESLLFSIMDGMDFDLGDNLDYLKLKKELKLNLGNIILEFGKVSKHV